ncbi:hypothetical protein QJS10_CPB14g00527 [Acorus calamus]|uniref:starch synthase n=1 Tax=Acorus calamus TaxID=4465 RepID=A0AAV9DGJ9_ACOCL|nr:hypothetical protein QJS10_CPB14g00527 [Acorus calamus]
MASAISALSLGRCCLSLSFNRTVGILSPRSLPVSCKMRQRNSSFPNRRKHAKKSSPERPPLNLNVQPIDEDSTEVSIVNADSESNPDKETVSNFDSNTNSLEADVQGFEGLPFLEDKLVDEEDRSEENLSNVKIEDLISMIRNAEKNILLLNQARVSALQDLDKILSEKEALQGEMNILETRLAETDAQIKVAEQEKIRVELLEKQLEKLKSEISERDTFGESKLDTYENMNSTLNMDVVSDADNFPSLVEELSSLKKENMLLKDDIQILKAKLLVVKEADERALSLEKERSTLEATLRDLESQPVADPEDVSKLGMLKAECEALQVKVENLQSLLENANKQADEAITVLQQNHELQKKVDRLEKSLNEANAFRYSPEKSQQYNDLLQHKVKILEERLQMSDLQIQSHIQLYQKSVKEFQDTLKTLKEESKRKALDEPVDDMPWKFWSRLLLVIDGWLLEKKISSSDAKILREMAWKRDGRIRDAYLACKDKNETEAIDTFLKLTSDQASPGLHIIHIAAEIAPVAKVGGLGDVVTGLSKALQKKGHLVEIVLPKYDCMQDDSISDLRVLDVVVQSYFDGRLFKNKIWVGTVEGLPVYFIEPHHPDKFFWRGEFYGEHDDFRRFSYFSRAAVELLFQAGKKPDIIHCHDWQTAFVAPLYWDIYASQGFNSARICFTCHNFEYQGKAPASELASCGLDVHNLNRPDRMQDNSAHDRVNPVKGAIVFSNIVTTVSPTYAQEVRTPESGHGLHATLNSHSRKFIGILNGIDTDAWNPSTDPFLRFQYNADDLEGKAGNKEFIRKYLKLSSSDATQPLREFEGIASHFQDHPHVRLVLKYDDALSRSIYAASDMLIVPSIFEPCGLTQMIAMRYGSVPIVRKTGGLNDSVFDIDDDTVPVQFHNGFTFSMPDEQEVSRTLERAFKHYKSGAENWQKLVQKVMKMDFGWESSAAQYEEVYQNAVARARVAART